MFTIISDIHCHNHKTHAKIENGVNSRLEQGLNSIRQAVNFAIANKSKALLICGDLFHVKGVLKPSVFKRVQDEISNASKYLDVVIISGNHDFESYLKYEENSHQEGSSMIDILSDTKFKISKPQIFDLHGQKFGAIPFLTDIKDFKKELVQMAAKGINYIMIHQGIDGLYKNSAIPSTGLSVEFLEEVTEKYNITRIFSGHYHAPAISKTGKVVMVGSPYHQNFSDIGIDMGLWNETESGCNFHKLNYVEFIDVDLTKPRATLPDLKNKIARILVKSESKIDKLNLDSAESVSVQIQREFTTTHEKAIEPSESTLDMFTKFVNNDNKIDEEMKREIMKFYEQTCL